MDQNPYHVLGVPVDAGRDEIKRAYRRLARQYHPDLSGASDGLAFLRLQQAYETLVDPESRQAYDQRFTSRPRPSTERRVTRSDAFSAEHVVDFGSVRDILDRMREAFFGGEQDEERPLRGEILLTPQEAYRGTTVTLGLDLRHPCPHCGGRGEIWMDACHSCGGLGLAPMTVPVKVHIPPGVRSGHCLQFSIHPTHTDARHVELRVVVMSG